MVGGTLPVSVSSTVWVRMHEEQIQLWRAMISGPEGTPYSAGCFVFDILAPSDYPNVAPKVNLQTTGGGSVRFNPNLYNCGKVCLSLLGTWQGDQGESWHAKTSTLLQVLMSIQALILVPDPFFNEPGYERNRAPPPPPPTPPRHTACAPAALATRSCAQPLLLTLSLSRRAPPVPRARQAARPRATASRASTMR